MFVLWLTQSFHGLALWTIAVLGVSLFFLPGINVVSWKETRKEIDYEVPFLIAGTNVVAVALTIHWAKLLSLFHQFIQSFYFTDFCWKNLGYNNPAKN